MLTICFEKHEENYKRVVQFPDKTKHECDGVVILPKWHYPETWSWIKPLYEYSRDELAKEGQAVAEALLGNQGIDFLRENNGNSLKIIITENKELPEISRVPWEIACIDGEFVLTDLFIPIIRRPDHIRIKSKLQINRPLRMALLSASPQNQDTLMVEEELISVALALGESIAEGRIIVDEILNCTREKLKEIFRSNPYDIVYFTGHGAFRENTGYLILESPDGSADFMSSSDFVSALRRQQDVVLVFLNCCNAAAVGRQEAEALRGFDDVARRVLKLGVPEVIATQAAIFDITGRTIMKAFFEELCRDKPLDVAAALTIARCDVESDHSQFHDFYQFVHFSALHKEPQIEIRQQEDPERPDENWQDKIVHRTENKTILDKNFVGRFSYISQIEDGWWMDSVKTIGIHGLGGIGKTFLCNRMEERVLMHPVTSKRMNQSIWIDFREGKGKTLAGFLTQLAGIAHDLGFTEYQKVLDDHEIFPAPLEKLRPLNDHLNARFKGKVLLILDNLETVVDQNGVFHDREIKRWFRELTVRTPLSTKVLVTCRHRFNFFPEGRQLVKTKWIHLTELGFTERICLINQHAELRNLQNDQKHEILRIAGGHPFLVNLIVSYLQRNPVLPDAIKNASREAAEYAKLDGFLSLLSAEALDWLCIAAIFPEPRIFIGLRNTKLIRDSIEDRDRLQNSYQASVNELVDLSLIMVNKEEMVNVHPLIVYQLLENQESRYIQPARTIAATQAAIGKFFYSWASQIEERPDKAQILIHGIEPVLAQYDVSLLNDYLQSCAGTFYGFIPASVFADIVLRAESVLLENADQGAFYTLGFCAHTLISMRDFHNALNIYERMLSNERLPDEYQGKVLASKGTIYLQQRNWDKALKNYQLAINWNDKTGNHVQLGSTYHQIGMVYEEQKDFSNAFDAYKIGVEISIKTENVADAKYNLTSLRRISPELSPEAIATLKDVLPKKLFQEVIESE